MEFGSLLASIAFIQPVCIVAAPTAETLALTFAGVTARIVPLVFLMELECCYMHTCTHALRIRLNTRSTKYISLGALDEFHSISARSLANDLTKLCRHIYLYTCFQSARRDGENVTNAQDLNGCGCLVPTHHRCYRCGCYRQP